MRTFADTLRQEEQPHSALCLEATDDPANLAEGRATLGELSFVARICIVVDAMVGRCKAQVTRLQEQQLILCLKGFTTQSSKRHTADLAIAGAFISSAVKWK